ncbi:hypothetical protein QBC39DRAFT_253485, partial [Podospora conica]
SVVGIDLGSTGTRATVRPLVKGKEEQYIHVEDKANPYGNASRFDITDFPSMGYPFEATPGAVYLPHAAPETVQDRQPMSLKYGMYLLSDASKNLVKEYPAVEHVCRFSGDPDFRKRARTGLVELMTTVLLRVNNVGQQYHLCIRRIALTVPVQWTLEFEDVYSEIMVEALADVHHRNQGQHFAVTKEDIFFITETEALAAYMFDFELDQMRPKEGKVGSKAAYFLFFDFGGHNMAKRMWHVCPPLGQSRPERRRGREGNGGGSEHWEFLMGERCITLIGDEGHHRPDNKAFTDLMQIVNLRKRAMGPPNGSRNIPAPILIGDTFQTILLKADKIDEDWHTGFEGVLDMAREKLAAFRKAVPSGSNCTVVIAGGSSANRALQKYLGDAAEANNLPPPIFAAESDRLYGSSRIAKGAAYAIANLRTVQQFFRDGAAIGIQRRCGRLSGGSRNDPLLQWETSSEAVLIKNSTRVVIIESYGTDDFKLICDPFFAPASRAEPSKSLNLDGCYDLAYLGKRALGEWRFRVSVKVVLNIDRLVIEEAYRRKPSSAWSRRRTLLLPVHFVPGSNTVIVGERNKTLRETLKAHGLTKMLPKNPDGSDGRGDESEDEDDKDDEDDEIEDIEDVGSEGGAAKEADDDYRPDQEDDEQEEQARETIPRGTRSRPSTGPPPPTRGARQGRFTATRITNAERKRKRASRNDE